MLKQDEILRGRYRVIKCLGQGGMGAVYEAHDNVFDTSVALKEVIIDLSDAVDTKAQDLATAAFEREAKILAKINHETIPHVKDYFVDNDCQFLVMELVDGGDLAKLLKERNSAFPVSTLMDWTNQLLEALDYLHTQNPPIIHRDIKPQNLKLTTRNKIKLLDFGIAKGTESLSANTITNQTFIAATLNYSPIEQMIKVLDPTFLAVITHKYGSQVEAILQQHADVRTDLFALGATIYHLATNKHPAEAIKRGVDIWDGKPDPLEDPRSLNTEISDDFAILLTKAMQVARDQRFVSAAEMRSELHRIMDVPTQQSLKPTLAMNFEPLTGDATTPMIPSPSAPRSKADDTLENASPSSVSEFKTEIIDPDTAKRVNEEVIGKTGGSADPTGESFPVAEEKKRSKLLWLIPIAGVLLFVFAAGIIGVFVVVNQMSKPAANTNVEIAAPEETPEAATENSPDEELTTEPNQPPPSDGPVVGSTPERQDLKPATPAPYPVNKSIPVYKATQKPPTPTPKPKTTPTPKKNMDCIFNDSC